MPDHQQPAGGQLPRRTLPTDLRGVVEFAAGSGDFNPIHFDRDAAHGAGHADPILQGLLKAGWLADFAVDAVGGGWVLEEYEVTYRGPDLVGDQFVVGGASQDTENTAVLDVWGGSNPGKPTTFGQARFTRGER